MSDDIVINRRHLKTGALVGIGVLAVILIGGAVTRLQAHNDLKARAADISIPTVTVVRPTQNQSGKKLTLPGALEAWAQAPVYARTSGYLKSWHADIGQTVKEGQVLAEIDAPELDQQLAAAEANLATANANRALAATTAERWQKLVAQDAVSRQEADEKLGNLAARNAMANAARADVDRLRALQGFKRIVAPFDGVVTSRSTDIGALIAAGGGARPLFTVADMRKMRIYVRVPQAYSTSVRTGMKVELTVPEYTDRSFEAELVRSADAVNDQSGTMLVQLAADNPEGLLKSGAYASVNFTLDTPANVVRVPASTLMIRKEGTMVATVDADNRVTLKTVIIVQDLGADVYIGAGLTASDSVIDNPPEIVTTGDKVRLQDTKAKTPDAAG